jgi:arylsulfatase A-like enzyme
MGIKKSEKPNILFFYIDGMQGRVLDEACECHTPNFDRISKEGVKFTNAFTCTPTCSPARASLMTGLLPHNHGVLQVEHCVDDDQSQLRLDKPHWAQHLIKAGYKTGYWGKWHIERTYKLDNFGWQEHCSEYTIPYKKMLKPLEDEESSKLDKNITRYQTGPEGYNPILHYAVTDAKIEDRPISLPGKLGKEYLSKALLQNEPWCCCVSNSAPNEQMFCGREAFNMYDIDSIKLPLNLKDDLKDRPAIYHRTQKLWDDVTIKQWKEARACYYGRITELDAEFGKLLKQIEDAGQLDNTIILITSDHGKYVGGHGMEAHNFGAFEEIYNIPLIMSGPGIAKGETTKAQVSIQDICPTLLELTDSEPINVHDSKSFAKVLNNPAKNESEYISTFGEYHGTRFPLMQRIYRENNWKYVFNGFDFDELYNLEEDPYEMNNLADKPEYHEKVRSMMTEVWKKIYSTNDKALKETHYFSMRFAPIGPNSIL